MSWIPDWMAFWRPESPEKTNLKNNFLAAKLEYRKLNYNLVERYLRSIKKDAEAGYKRMTVAEWKEIEDAASIGLTAFSMREKISMVKFKADIQLCFKKLKKAIAKIT